MGFICACDIQRSEGAGTARAARKADLKKKPLPWEESVE